MMTITMITMYSLMLKMMSSSNPMKTTAILLGLSSVIFISSSMWTGDTFMPTLYYMMFMGGILVMMAILSSLMPNQKPFMTSSSKVVLAFLSVATMLLSLEGSEMKMSGGVKMLMSSDQMMFTLIIFMLCYFFFFVSMITMEKSSMRS